MTSPSTLDGVPDIDGIATANEVPEVLSLVVAVADNGLIGRDGALPWHLPDDLRYFKRVTWGKPIIMGRKTFVSLGKPLPGRTNIVLTRDSTWSAEGAVVVHSLEAALHAARLATPTPTKTGGREIMVIGGADVFALSLPRANRLYLTEVHMCPDGDVYFPPFDREDWRETAREAGQADSEGYITHHFVVLERHDA